MRKTYNYSKLSIRNTDLYYQVAGEGGEVWYQGRGVFEILDMDWNCRLVERISKKNKRTMNCEWVRLRPISWFLNVAGIKEALEGRYSEYLSKDGQTGYALLQSFVRMQRKPQPEQQALPMPLPTLEAESAPEPVRMEPEPDPEPVNTEANIAGANQTFAFRGQNVRTVIKNGKPWFVAKDVCDVLGLANSREAVTRVPTKNRGSVRLYDGTSPRGGNPNYTIINEAGLYRLVLRSDKPAAEPFIDWVTSEVLPALRKKSEPELVRAEPVNTEANLAGLNVTPDAMARKMSSREIAELTGKEHKNVIRDIRGLIEQGAINQLNFEPVEYTDAKGEKRPEYLLDFDATMTLVTGYNAVLRAKVIRRWRELETGEARPAMPKAQEPAPCKTWGDNNMPTAAMLEEFRAWKGVAVECGLDNNAACISANGVLDRNYGVSPLQIARIQLIAPGNEQYLIPSAIADILAQEGLCNPGTRGAQTVNAALAHMGLQTNTKDSITGKNNWHVTVSGKEAGARIIDTTKRDNHGKMVQQILWPLSIVDTLKSGFFRQ